MLMIAGEIHDLRHLGFRHLESVDTADADTLLVDVQHDAVGIFAGPLLKNVSRTCTTNSIGV
jgi:hypothetical protein